MRADACGSIERGNQRPSPFVCNGNGRQLAVMNNTRQSLQTALQFSRNQMPCMPGKTCVITAATSGLGKAAALMLGELGANLILIGRNELLGTALATRLRKRSEDIRVE